MEIRNFIWRTRYITIAICLGVAVVTGIETLRPEPAGPLVVRTTRDLSVGEKVTAADVEIIRIPASLAASDLVDSVSAAIGEQVLIALPQHTMLTPQMFVSSVSERIPAGEVIVSLSLSDLGPGITPGTKIDLYEPPQDCFDLVCAARLLAENILVVQVAESEKDTWSDGYRRVDLACSSTTAKVILGTSTLRSLRIAIHPGNAP